MPNYSMKPGRGPSGMGVVGGIVGVLFGIVWTIMAFSMASGAPAAAGIIPKLFPLIGVVVVIASIVGVFYNLHNARGENRFSEFDIVESHTEPDPLAPRQPPPPAAGSSQTSPGGYCRSCGAALRTGDHFCGRCGKTVSA